MSAIVCSALAHVGTTYGLGTHLYNITDIEVKVNAIKYTQLAPPFSIISTTTGKISIVLFLFRIMGLSTTKGKKWFLYILTIVSIILNAVTIFWLLGFCFPAERIWDQRVPGHCLSLQSQLVVGILQACELPFSAFGQINMSDICSLQCLYRFCPGRLPGVRLLESTGRSEGQNHPYSVDGCGIIVSYCRSRFRVRSNVLLVLWQPRLSNVFFCSDFLSRMILHVCFDIPSFSI